MIELVKYEPSEMDLLHVQEIRDFLISRNIEYIEDEEVFGLFHVNERTCQLRYVNSYYHPIDNSHRFGDICKGIAKDYFSRISHINAENGIRTIWIFDFEMEQTNTAIINGEIVENYLNNVLTKRDMSSNINTTVEVSAEDKIITLSTCNNNDAQRYLVQAVLLSIQE